MSLPSFKFFHIGIVLDTRSCDIIRTVKKEFSWHPDIFSTWSTMSFIHNLPSTLLPLYSSTLTDIVSSQHNVRIGIKRTWGSRGINRSRFATHPGTVGVDMVRPCDMTGVWSRIAQALREPVRAEYEKLGIFKGGAGTAILQEKGYYRSPKMSHTNLLGTEKHQPRIVLFPEDQPGPPRTLLRGKQKPVQYLIWARKDMTGIGLVLRETVPKPI